MCLNTVVLNFTDCSYCINLEYITTNIILASNNKMDYLNCKYIPRNKTV